MQTRRILLALAALAAAPAFAQALGTVTSVNGVVTVTTSTGGTRLVEGAPIVHGSRVVTTSASSVTLRLANGCTVNVPPAHGVTVLSTLSCQQLQAAVLPLAPVAATPATNVMGQAGGGMFSDGNAVVGLWAAGVLATVVYDLTEDDDVVVAPPLSPQ